MNKVPFKRRIYFSQRSISGNIPLTIKYNLVKRSHLSAVGFMIHTYSTSMLEQKAKIGYFNYWH